VTKTVSGVKLVNYQRVADFQVDLNASSGFGPSPAGINVTTTGVVVDLSKLVMPTWCWLANQDPTNYVEYGIRDPSSGKFYPLGELGPGDAYPIKLSRNLLEEWHSTGTSGDVNQFWMQATGGTCNVLVEAFEN
jgi:hypothetical protein